MKPFIQAIAVLLALPVLVTAQTPRRSRGEAYFFFAPGVGPQRYRPSGEPDRMTTLHIGGGGVVFVYKGLGLSAELGAMGPWSRYGDASGVGSADLCYHFWPRTKEGRLEPFVAAGYTLYFRSGIADGYNVGGGVNVWLGKKVGLRFEVRDNTVHAASHYWMSDHMVNFRVGVTFR